MTSKYNWTTCVWEQQKLRVGWSKALESDWTHTDWYVSLHSRAYLSSHKSSPSLACLFLNNYTERFYGLASSLHLLLTIAFGPMQLSVMKMLFCWKLCSPTLCKRSMDKNNPKWKAMEYWDTIQQQYNATKKCCFGNKSLCFW